MASNETTESDTTVRQFQPIVPPNIKALTSHESATIDLSWTSVANATSYEIQRSSAYYFTPNFITIATISNTSTTNYTDKSNLINGQTYTYRIAASDGRSTSSFSSIVHAIAQLTCTDNFNAVTGHESASIDLSWRSIVGAAGYQIYRSSTANDVAKFTTIATIWNTTTTNYLDKSNLINGRTYYYRIAGIDGPSIGRFSSIVQAIPTLAPPGNVNATTGQESASIDLSWTLAVGATSYEIQRSSNNNDATKFTTIATISNTTTTNYFDKSNLINGQTYYYKIAGIDSRSIGRFSPIAQAIPKLAPPKNVKATTGQESASIDLSWRPITGATAYEIYRSSNNNNGAEFTNVVTISNTQTTNYVDKSNLINEQHYYYRIAGRDDQSTGRISSVVQATPQLAPPSIFKAVPGQESASIDLLWTFVVGATGYEIQRSSAYYFTPNFTTIATISNTSTTNYTDQLNLTNGQTYYYKIAATHGQSTTSFSSMVHATPQLAPPRNFQAVPGQESASIDLSWTFVVAANAYEIYRSSNNNNEAQFTRIATISNTQTTNYIDKSNLINGQTYYYTITGSDGRSTARFSSILQATPQLPPPVTFKALTGHESASIDLSWTFVVDATQYELYRSSNNNDEAEFVRIAIIPKATTTNYVDKSNLINGKTYYYKIAGSDGGFTGRFSSIGQATAQLPAPGNFKAVTGEDSAAIDLYWTVVIDATGYEIHRSSTNHYPENFTRIATISNKTTTNYVDKSNLINGQTYYYKIAGRDGGSTGRYSCILQAIPQLSAPVTVIAVTGEESASIELSWNVLISANGYEIQRSLINNDPASFTIIATIWNTTTTNYTDKSNLINGKIYYYKIAGINGRSAGRFSSIVQATPQLSAPRNVKALTGQESTCIHVSWEVVIGAKGYQIYRSLNSNDAAKFTRIATISHTTTKYLDKSNLINGETYYYRIAGSDGGDTGRFSSIVQGTPKLPSPPNFNAVTGKESASIDLSWAIGIGARGYEIQRLGTNNHQAHFTTIATISNTTTINYTDKSDLINGRTYYYKIAGTDGGSTGRFAPTVKATPRLPAPVNFTAVTGEDSAAIDLSWALVVDATGYEIHRSSINHYPEKFSTIATILNTTTRNYTDKSNLINAQTYYYKIAGIDAGSTGRFSCIVQATPQLSAVVTLNAVTGQESACIELSWTVPISANGYEIHRSLTNKDPAGFTRIATILKRTTTNYTDKSNLINGETHYYKIAGTDGRSTGRFSSIVQANPLLEPPGNLNAVMGLESASIDLSWAVVNGSSCYEIHRSLSSNDPVGFTRIATVSNTTKTTYTDKLNLINGKTYCYKIAGSDGRYIGRFSAIVQATPELSAPGNVKALTGQESTSIDLTWEVVIGATGYEIQRSSSNNDQPPFTRIATISNTTTTNYSDKLNLINGEIYYYKIAGSDGGSTGRFSATVEATPQLQRPCNFNVVTGPESASIDLSWAVVIGATAYEIQRSPTNNAQADFTTIATISNTTTTHYTDKSNLINGQTYYYKIGGRDGELVGRFSSIVPGTPELPAPGNFKVATGPESACLDLCWVAVIGSKGYEIQRSSTNNGAADFTVIATIWNTRTTNYTDKSNLMNGQTYYYKIAARDGRSVGRFSFIVQANPQLPPPRNFKVVTGEASASLDLFWAPVIDASGYEIQRSCTKNDPVSFATIVTILNTGTTNYTDKSNLTNGETYYYKIAARDGQSTIRFSSIVEGKPQLLPPVNFKAVIGKESACIDLSWAIAVGATGYEIQRSAISNDQGDFTTVATFSNWMMANYIDKSNLINGQTYYYRIAASDGRSVVRFSSIVEAIPQLAPPANFKAVTGQESASIDLCWTFVVGATEYEIHRSSTNDDPVNFNRIATISNTTTSKYTDKWNLNNGQPYYYKIVGRDGGSGGRFSAIAQAKPQFPAPCNFKAVTGLESGSIDLAWAVVIGVRGYEIQRSTTSNDGANFSTIASILNTTTSNYTDKSNLINGQTYYYKIAGSDGGSPGRFSSIGQATPQLPAPGNLKAVTGEDSASIDLSWAIVIGATRYEIHRSSTNNDRVNFTRIGTIANATTTNFTDKSNLINEQTYYYKIAAGDGGSTGRFCSIVQAKPQLSAPGNLKAVTGPESASIGLSWAAVIGARGYVIQRSATDNVPGNFATISNISSTTTTNYTDNSNLINGETYYYKIATSDGRSVIRFSSIVQATPQLPAPGSFNAITGQESVSIDLSWAMVTGARGYEIQRSGTNNDSAYFTTIVGIWNTTTTKYTDKSDLINGQTYYYKIVARDGRSTGRVSPVVNAVPYVRPPINLQATSIHGRFCGLSILGSIKEVESQLPATWEPSTGNQLRYLVANNAAEYKSVLTNFDQMMKRSYTQIIKLERIQNKRWFMQYSVHRQDFIERLNSDTEKILYHGCPEQAADLIIQDCFNRSFAGVNGTLYGFGVYFSSNAGYSHGYTRNNAKGERCMFVSRVLIGRSTIGNQEMKVRPAGFDSTTDGNSIFVTYHDAQAYAEYLITYK